MCYTVWRGMATDEMVMDRGRPSNRFPLDCPL